MYINEINPHLRYVDTIKYLPVAEYMCAVDYHFYYINSQGVSISIKDREYATGRGTVVIVPPGTRYVFDVELGTEIISINFDYTQNNTDKKPATPVSERIFNPLNIIEKVEFCDYTFLNEPVVLTDMSYLKQMIDTVLYEYKYKKQLYAVVASSCFRSILTEVFRTIIVGSKNNESVDKVLSYIHGHYAEEIDNTMLSNIAGYHSYHLNRLMKKFTGETLRQYIINYRIEVAKDYLHKTNISISKISELCGYANFSNFSCDFKRKTGVTPSVYRRESQHIL